MIKRILKKISIVVSGIALMGISSAYSVVTVEDVSDEIPHIEEVKEIDVETGEWVTNEIEKTYYLNRSAKMEQTKNYSKITSNISIRYEDRDFDAATRINGAFAYTACQGSGSMAPGTMNLAMEEAYYKETSIVEGELAFDTPLNYEMLGTYSVIKHIPYDFNGSSTIIMYYLNPYGDFFDE